MIKRLKPDVLHATSLGFMVLVCGIYAKIFVIPLTMTYHTHLPVHARNYLGWFPFILPSLGSPSSTSTRPHPCDQPAAQGRV